jgi:hypothetical protein
VSPPRFFFSSRLEAGPLHILLHMHFVVSSSPIYIFHNLIMFRNYACLISLVTVYVLIYSYSNIIVGSLW